MENQGGLNVRFRALLLGIVLAATSTIALAQLTGTPEEQRACRGDVRKLCSQVSESSGAEAFKACLQQNYAKLSPKCQAVLQAHK